MVERSAVNRLVVGSNPTSGANSHIIDGISLLLLWQNATLAALFIPAMNEQGSSRPRRPTPFRQFTLVAAMTCTAVSLAFAAPGGDKGPPADKGKPAKESPTPTATPEASSSPTSGGGGGSGRGGGPSGSKKSCPLPEDYLVKKSSKRSDSVRSPEKPPQLFAVCHNGNILCLPEPAYSAHISHGDAAAGSCTKMGNSGPCTQ